MTQTVKEAEKALADLEGERARIAERVQQLEASLATAAPAELEGAFVSLAGAKAALPILDKRIVVARHELGNAHGQEAAAAAAKLKPQEWAAFQKVIRSLNTLKADLLALDKLQNEIMGYGGGRCFQLDPLIAGVNAQYAALLWSKGGGAYGDLLKDVRSG